MNRTRGLFIPFAGLFLCLSAGGAAAEIYKWVDKDGNVQYTQSPPPDGIAAQEIQPPPPPADAAEAEQALEMDVEGLEKAAEAKKEQAAEKLKTQADADKEAKLCEQAKARMASYERPRVTIPDPSAEGGRRRATEEERVAELAKSEALVKELCK